MDVNLINTSLEDSVAQNEAVNHRFTLIVATRNRPELLYRMLRSICEQQYQEVHVIVIDQSDAGNASENQRVIRSCEQCISLEYKRSTSVGLSSARNEGLELVQSGGLIAFPDDDCWYQPALLKVVNDRFIGERKVDIVLGQYAEPEPGFNARFPQRPQKLSAWNAFGASVGFFFSSDVFLRSGVRFDERIGAGTEYPAAEELDVLLSALSKGYRAIYDPSIVVYHAVDGRTGTGRLQHAQEMARSYVLGKHVAWNNVVLSLRVIGRTISIATQALYNRGARNRLSGMVQGYMMAVRKRWD